MFNIIKSVYGLFFREDKDENLDEVKDENVHDDAMKVEDGEDNTKVKDEAMDSENGCNVKDEDNEKECGSMETTNACQEQDTR